MAAAAATAVSMLTHRLARVSHDIRDLETPAVNVVHVRRPHAAVALSHDALLSTTTGRRAVVDARKPEAAAAYLLEAVVPPGLQQQLHADLTQAVQLLSSVLQLDHVHAKLQLITQQSCPNWHADRVGVRLLCTYCGPGTWYVPNRFVRRRFDPWTGDVSIAGVDERHAVQAAAGDLLYLKGGACPGLHGAGAVHKSPLLEDGDGARLVLTVDDAC